MRHCNCFNARLTIDCSVERFAELALSARSGHPVSLSDSHFQGDQLTGKVSVRFYRIEKRSQLALHSRCIQSDTPAMSGEHATEAFVNESLEGAKLGGPVVPAGVSKGMQSMPAEIPTQ